VNFALACRPHRHRREDALPAAQARGGSALDIAARLRLDHGAIAAPLVPTPTPAVVATLRHILRCIMHSRKDRRGSTRRAIVYSVPRPHRLVADGRDRAVRASPHNDAPAVMPSCARAQRAGYRLLESA
jgi:hypothetical protein